MSIFRRHYTVAEEAVLLLIDALNEADPNALRNSPASGCCGCGSWLADVVTHPSDGYPLGEHYCWRCVDKRPHLTPDEYCVLPGRER